MKFKFTFYLIWHDHYMIKLFSLLCRFSNVICTHYLKNYECLNTCMNKILSTTLKILVQKYKNKCYVHVQPECTADTDSLLMCLLVIILYSIFVSLFTSINWLCPIAKWYRHRIHTIELNHHDLNWSAEWPQHSVGVKG